MELLGQYNFRTKHHSHERGGFYSDNPPPGFRQAMISGNGKGICLCLKFNEWTQEFHSRFIDFRGEMIFEDYNQYEHYFLKMIPGELQIAHPEFEVKDAIFTVYSTNVTEEYQFRVHVEFEAIASEIKLLNSSRSNREIVV